MEFLVRKVSYSACEFERGLVLIRNPFDAIMAAYNHHMAGKTGEPPMTVFEGEKWPSFISDWAARWYNFHYEWFNNFQGPIQVSCFDRLVHDPVEEVGHWLDFLDLDHRRLGCINHDPVGQFYRKKTNDYSHLFPTKGKNTSNIENSSFLTISVSNEPSGQTHSRGNSRDSIPVFRIEPDRTRKNRQAVYISYGVI